MSLESLYFSQVTAPYDLGKGGYFDRFIIPNEMSPVEVKPHLLKARQGTIGVSVGTERSFFNLTFVGNNCKGLVVLDVSRKVKAYVDCNCLLLRISDSCQEYESLSRDLFTKLEMAEDDSVLEGKKSSLFPSRLAQIRTKMQARPAVLGPLQKYYEENLESIANVYFSVRKQWRLYRKTFFQEVQYHKDAQAFKVLQTHARLGNIIALVGDLNRDLKCLEDQDIGWVDVSNVPHYVPIDLHGIPLKDTLLIWTSVHLMKTDYFSKKYETFHDEKLRGRFQRGMEILQKTKTRISRVDTLKDLSYFTFLNSHNAGLLVERLEHYVANHVVEFPSLGYVDLALEADRHFCRINQLNDGEFSTWAEKWAKNMPEDFDWDGFVVKASEDLRADLYLILDKHLFAS